MSVKQINPGDPGETAAVAQDGQLNPQEQELVGGLIALPARHNPPTDKLKSGTLCRVHPGSPASPVGLCP
jgi:hypothetical protein